MAEVIKYCRFGIFFILAIGFLTALAFSPAIADEVEKTRIDTPLGPVIGFTSGEVTTFLGLPFAAPPVGEHRFAPPRDVEGWVEPREALKPGPMAYQVDVGMILESVAPDKALPGYSEDCLNLNVWVPKGAKAGDGLPVYVFIHGGGFGLGSGSQSSYSGTALAKEGVVVVTFNYRLGGLGFFSSQETFKQYGTTGNWGILDQIKALEWVRDNIAAFGGDPQKVTIGGESAGSFSVAALILSPKAKGLFRGAIMESGTIFALDVFPFARGNLSLSFNLSSLLLSIFGATDDAEGLARFREADPALLTRLTPFSFDFAKFGAFGLSPVMDGNVIPLDPQKSLAQGEGQKVKVLMGFNGNEGSLFVPAANGKEDPQVYKDAVALALGAEASKAFWERYPIDDNHGAVERARQAFGYSFMTSNMKRFADLQARQSDLYFYQFHYVSKDGKDFGLGAYHSAELAFVFGVKEPNHNDTEAEQVLSDEMRLRWVNFIKNGDPNLGLAPPTALEWPKYDPKDPRVIIFDQQVSVAPLPDQEGLDFMAEAIWGPLP